MYYELICWHLRATGSKHLLNDSLLDEDGWQEVTDWLADACMKRLADDGLQVVAWVLPRHHRAFFDTAKVLAQLQQPRVDTFTDAQAAYDWLHHQYWSALHTPAQLPLILTVAAFLDLSNAEQLLLIEQQGRAQAPRWDGEYYIQPYLLPAELLVELYYHAHSGVLYQVRARLIAKG
jgi:hypothetical protein